MACPEQYDAHDKDGKQLAYLRLRHSVFKVYCPDFGGDLVYQAELPDFNVGVFSNEERDEHLKKAVEAIAHYWNIPAEYKIIDEWEDDNV